MNLGLLPTTMLGELERAAWIRRQLVRFTYKKGWSFSVSSNPYACFTIHFKCEDTYNPGEEIEVGKSTPLWMVPTGDEEVFALWLAGEIKDVEMHESREWLKRDGKIFDDPHAVA